MTNHEASARRCQTRALPLPLLAILLAKTALAAVGPDPVVAGGGGPARPGESSPPRAELTLDLDALTGPAAGDRERDGVAAEPSPPIVAGTAFGIAEVRSFAAAFAIRQQTPTSSTEPAPSNGSFGHWLKRHWWVPVLVGGAVLYTAGESLYDDDDHDDED